MKASKVKDLIMNNKMLTFALVASSTVLLHYILIHAYIYLCVGTGISGLFKTFISLGSPVCQFMNYVQYELSKYYITAWAAAELLRLLHGL